MTVSQILELASKAVSALAGAGVKVPSQVLAILAEVPAALAVGEAVVSSMPSVSSLVTTGNFAVPQAVIDMSLKAVGVSATGIAEADSAIKAIEAGATTVTSSLHNLLAGQAVSLASDNVHISGTAYHVHIVAVVSGGPAALALGL